MLGRGLAISAEHSVRGLSTAVVLCLAALALILPFVGLTVWQGMFLAERERADLLRQASTTAAAIRSHVDRALSAYVATLNTLATAPEVDRGDLEGLHKRARAALEPLGLHVLMRDLTGQQLFNTRMPYGAPLPVEKGFDDAALETKQPYVTDVVIGAVAKTPVVGISVPVVRQDEVRFLLTLSINPQLFGQILDQSALPPGWTADLVDRQGVRIARSDRQPGADGRPVEPDRGPGAAAAAPMPETPADAMARQVSVQSIVSDWMVVVAAPEAALSGGVSAAVLQFALISGLLGLVGLLAAYLLGRRIVAELATLRHAADDLGAKEPVRFTPGLLREANVVGRTLKLAADLRDAHDAQVQTLMGEVNHRSKNLMTIVQAIARQTKADSLEAFRDKFFLRIHGLATSQDALVHNLWRSADLRELVQAHLAGFVDVDSDRVRLEGPQMAISSDAAQAIGMALHELATNAAKYGALSNANGRIAIEWKTGGNGDAPETPPEFHMVWRETGGPPVVAPDGPNGAGFGYAVVIDNISMSLDAKASIEYLESGVVWTLIAPLAAIRDAA